MPVVSRQLALPLGTHRNHYLNQVLLHQPVLAQVDALVG
jgi:hypothetical protein